MSIYYPAGKNSDQPLLDMQDYLPNVVRNYDVSQLTSRVRPPTAQEYYSLNYVDLQYSGYHYPDTTTLSIQGPSIEEGTQAVCSPSFGLTRYSLTISGNDHTVGDVYIIYPSDSEEDTNNQATIKLTVVLNGVVISYEVLESGYNFHNSSNIITYRQRFDEYFLGDFELIDNVTLINDEFCISKVNINSEGSGYARYDQNNRTIKYTINVNSNQGSGFYATILSQTQIRYDYHSTIRNKAKDRSRSPFKNKYGQTEISINSTNLYNDFYTRTIIAPQKTQTYNQQNFTTYSFNKTINDWTPLEIMYDYSSDISGSSEDECSSFGDGFVYAGLAFSGSFDFESMGDVTTQYKKNREWLIQRIQYSSNRVLNDKKITQIVEEVIRARLISGKDVSIDHVFSKDVIRTIARTIGNDVIKKFKAGADYKSLGFTNFKDLTNFVSEAVRKNIGQEAQFKIRQGIIAAMNNLSSRLPNIIGPTWTAGGQTFTAPFRSGNPDLRKIIDRRVKNIEVWTDFIREIETKLGEGLGYIQGNFISDPFPQSKPKPRKVKSSLLSKLKQALGELRKQGVITAKCVGGKTVIKNAGRAAKVLAIYFFIEEVARAETILDYADATGNLVSPLPPEWFTGEGQIDIIDLSKIPQQNKEQLESQLSAATAKYIAYGDAEAFRAEINLILENFASKTVDDSGDPIGPTDIQTILQNIIDDAEDLKTEMQDEGYEDLDLDLEELKRQIDFYDLEIKNTENLFSEIFGNSDICDCPSDWESKIDEFNSRLETQIGDGSFQQQTNSEPLTLQDWKKMDMQNLGFPIEFLQGGLPTVSIMRMETNNKDNLLLPAPRNTSIQSKPFNDLDMYKLR